MKNVVRTETVSSYWVQIHLSGPLAEIEQACRKDFLDKGLCVTVTPTKFIYTGGEETGAVVRLLNYHRFSASSDSIWERACDLALKLLEATHQMSILVEDSVHTVWMTKRDMA